jgi:hypothetical protein
VYDTLSPGLHGDLVLFTNSRWFERVPWLQTGVDQSFLVVLARSMTHFAAARMEVFGQPNRLYMLEKGVVSVGKRVLTTNDVWQDQQVLLYSPTLLSLHKPAYSLTFTMVQALKREAIVEACEAFPHNGREIRRTYVRQVFRAAVRYIAALSLEHVANPNSPHFAVDRSKVDFSMIGAPSELLTINNLLDNAAKINQHRPRVYGGYGVPVTSDAPSTTPAALSDLHSVHGSLEARVMQKLDALYQRVDALASAQSNGRPPPPHALPNGYSARMNGGMNGGMNGYHDLPAKEAAILAPKASSRGLNGCMSLVTCGGE